MVDELQFLFTEPNQNGVQLKEYTYQSNHFRMKSIFLVFLITFVLSISVEEFKHNQGSPSEFEHYKLPIPTESAQSSDSSILHGFLTNVAEKKYEWKGDIFVDSLEFMSVTIASKLKNLKLTLEEPGKNSKKTPPPVVVAGVSKSYHLQFRLSVLTTL